MPASVAMPAVRQNRSKLAPTCCQASSTIAAGATPAAVVDFVMALLSFADSAPRAYRLKVGNAYLTFSTSTGASPGLLSFMPDGRYAVKSFATDDERNSVCAYGVFSATHTGQGGPCPPTGKSTTTDYVYVMDFDGDKIRHMTKIWNAGWAMKELGWG